MSFLKLPVTSVARGGALCGRGAETLGGVLDTFQLPSFLDGFSVLDVRLLHLTSRFRLGKEPHRMGYWAGRRRTCPFCCSAAGGHFCLSDGGLTHLLRWLLRNCCSERLIES